MVRTLMVNAFVPNNIHPFLAFLPSHEDKVASHKRDLIHIVQCDCVSRIDGDHRVGTNLRGRRNHLRQTAELRAK